MRFLLDTSAMLWSVAARHKLNSRAVQLLSSAASVLYLSSATAWEITLKYALGKLPLPMEPAAFLPEVIREMGLHSLDITLVHAVETGRLPRRHRDPFDRMLIAQANVEGLTLVTGDRIFEKYKVDQVFCGR